ncbi:MAG: PepSY domain-containing protein [Terracidiphilus sp.]
MFTQTRFLKLLRQLHLYVGTFIAPAILFFAFTGALQTFSLHDSSRDGTYIPSKWIVVLAQVHKKQIAQLPARKSEVASRPEAAPPKRDHAKVAAGVQSTDRPVHSPLPLKIFFLLVSIGLVASTFTGLYLSWKYERNAFAITALFVSGIIVPVVLLLV